MSPMRFSTACASGAWNRPSKERETSSAGSATGTVERSHVNGIHGGGDSYSSDEVAVFLQVCETTVRALEHVMKVKYSTLEYPWIIGPNKYFSFKRFGSVSCYTFQVRVMADHVSFNCLFPRSIPSNRRVKVAEFIARVNVMIILGQFDLDVNDGELRFRIVHDVASAASLTPGQIDKFFDAALSAMDKHYAAIEHVASGRTTPEEAVGSCKE